MTRFEKNLKAFLKDYSNEYTNGVYTGPKPPGWKKPKVKFDPATEAGLTPCERDWNAFWRDYSDEYTNGVYTGPPPSSSDESDDPGPPAGSSGRSMGMTPPGMGIPPPPLVWTCLP